MRALIFILFIAILAAGGLWLYNTDPAVREDVNQISTDAVSVEQQSTTVTVPTDVDVERKDGETLPDVNITTEEKTIEYPAVKVEENTDSTASDADIKPVVEEPNDPVPPITDVDVNEETGEVTVTQPAE